MKKSPPDQLHLLHGWWFQEKLEAVGIILYTQLKGTIPLQQVNSLWKIGFGATWQNPSK